MHVDFQTDAKFDNPRAIQLRLSAFDLARLEAVGRKVRDIFCQHCKNADRVSSLCDDPYIQVLAESVTGKLGGKVGIAPRIFLKKLVEDVMDRVDLHDEFNPRQDYKLTIGENELQPVEREAMAATNVDDINLEL